MNWREKPVSKLEITEGMQAKLVKMGFATLGDLADQWERDKFAGIKSEFGAGGYGHLVNELRDASGGEAAKEVPELAGVAAESGTPAAIVAPQGQTFVDLDDLQSLRRDRAALDEIGALSDRLVAETVDYQMKKDKALEAKKKKDGTTAELTNMIADRRRGQIRLPLSGDNVPPAASDDAGEAAADDDGGGKKKKKRGRGPAAEPPVALNGPDGWRTVPIDVLQEVEGAQPKLIARLQKAKIKTIGAFEEMRAARAWPKGFSDNDRDHMIEIALNWLRDNRDVAAYANAAAATEQRVAETITRIVLVEAIVDDRQREIHERLKVLEPVAMNPRDPAATEIGVFVNGSLWQLRPEQFVPAPATVRRPSRVQLTRAIPGSDTEEQGLFAGVEVAVARVSRDNVYVTAKNGAAVLLQPGEFEALEFTDWPVESEMILVPADVGL